MNNEKQDKKPSDVEGVVVPPGFEPVGNPPLSYRKRIAQARTVGELRKIFDGVDDETPLMVRNGPLPTIYAHHFYGITYVELD